jgi:RNA polymerase sigma-70 factor, ECF subfamily
MIKTPENLLAERYLAYLEIPQRAQVNDIAELETTLKRALKRAEEAWPNFEFEPEDFIAYLAERIPEDADPHQSLEQIHIEDLYLASATSGTTGHGNQAIAILQKQFNGAIDAALGRIRAARGFEDEAKQRLWEKLFVKSETRPAKISQYSGQGPLRSWLSVAASREALMLLRKKKPNVEYQDQLSPQRIVRSDDAERSLMKGKYQKHFRHAFQRSLQTLGARERNILRYHYVEGLRFDDIGSVYGVNRSTICRWLAKARQDLLAQTREEMQKELDINTAECESVMRLVNSQLDLSISRFLPATEDGDANGESP